MTVKELIEELQKFPQELNVLVWRESGDYDLEQAYVYCDSRVNYCYLKLE